MEEEKDKPIEKIEEQEVVFKTISDRMICGVQTEDTNETIFEISGYDLQIRFNRDKLNGVADIESMLDGIKDLFRQLVLKDLLKQNEEEG